MASIAFYRCWLQHEEPQEFWFKVFDLYPEIADLFDDGVTSWLFLPEELAEVFDGEIPETSEFCPMGWSPLWLEGEEDDS